MLHISDLLEAVPLPASDAVPDVGAPAPGPVGSDAEIVHEFGADLPAGHLHVWGGPPGAGKTAFLLTLLHGAARRGRRVVYATYDLPAQSLAMRLLAMAAGVAAGDLPDPGGPCGPGRLSAAGLARARAARAALAALPISFLPARGFTTRSLSDRLVRMPFRPEVVAVDYLQGVIRDPGTDPGVALRELSALAERLHVAVLCAVRADAQATGEAPAAEAPAGREGPKDAEIAGSHAVADRVGWIAPAAADGQSRARVIRNRHGRGPSEPLRFDARGGGFQRAGDESRA